MGVVFVDPLNSSPRRPIGSQYPLSNNGYPVPKSVPRSINQSISQSFSQSMARQAEDLSFLVPFLSLCPRFDFLGVLLVHVPRFSSTRDLDAYGHGPPCQRTEHCVAPLATAPLGYLHQLPARPDQNSSCFLFYPARLARRSSACPACRC